MLSYTVNDHVYKKILYFNTIPVLSYEIHYPNLCLISKYSCIKNSSIDRINRFYQEKTNILEVYCKDSLFPLAVEQYQYSKKNGFSFFPYEVISNFKVTLQTESYLSLYQDLYTFTLGAHGNTLRSSESWDLCNNKQITLAEIFPDKNSNEITQLLTSFIIDQIKVSLKSNSKDNMNYFDDYDKNVADSFNQNNFFLTPDGIVIYFQQYEIAPYSSGIPEFLFPLKNLS